MANDNEVTIERMIVHKLDHKKYADPLLSDLESPITDEVGSFLRQHIVSNREHKRTRTALFSDSVEHETKTSELCDQILADPGSFIDCSREIASHLFQTVTGDGRISPGDLVVLTFSDAAAGGSVWLALLKMDPEDGFVGEMKEINGQTRVELRKVPGVLPTGDLQKAAFILPPDLRKKRGHDLVVLDQQAERYGMRRLVASFFLKDFLQCQVGFKKEEETRTFIYQSRAWVNEKEEIWPVSSLDHFKQRTLEAVQGHQVDVSAFAQETIDDPQEQQEYITHIQRQGLQELTFEPDPTERDRWTKHRWFRGDNDLQVRIRADAVGEGKTLHETFDEATNTHTVTITTTVWQEDLKRIR